MALHCSAVHIGSSYRQEMRMDITKQFMPSLTTNNISFMAI